ncbi:patellin-3-like [Nymphaea colorata]|nr:patellin-3-like [Nymphaea colorata]
MADECKAPVAEVKETTEVAVKEAPPVDEKALVVESKPEVAEEKPEAAEGETKPAAEEAVAESASFKEETNVVAELEDPHKKALDELKQLIEQALKNNEFFAPPPAPKAEEAKPAGEEAVAQTPPPAAETAEVVEEKAEEKVEEKTEVKVEEVAAESAKVVVEEVPPPPPPAKATSLLEVVEHAVEKVLGHVTPAPPEAVPAPPEAAAPPAAPATAEEEGVKTVEAIEESVVSVTPPPAEPETAVLPPAAEEVSEAPAPPPEEVFIWDIPLLGGEQSDTLLLKFLRARDFKVKDTLEMIKKTARWRKEYKADELLEEDLGGKSFEKAVFMHGTDRDGHPVCYNVFGAFQDKELFQKTFSSAERDHFLRWRIQFLEKGIRQLDFSENGISTIVQVTDLKHSPGLLSRELQVTKKALEVLLDNYPELVAKQVVINVPWWYLAYTRVFNTIFTPRTKSKFVYAGPSRSTETLFKYIAPEQVPVEYGGLSKAEDSEFSTADAVTDLFVKPTSPHTIEIPVTEVCTLVWELRVLGWDVSYGAEFVPDAEDGYTVIIQKTRKVAATDEPVIRNSYKIGESGKVILKIENATSKKKKLLYRFKTKVAESN